MTRLIAIASRLLPTVALRMLGPGHELSRWARATLLRRRARALQAALVACDCPQQVLVDRSAIRAGEGIYLDALATDRYFKTTGAMAANEGEALAALVEAPRTIIDVGACFGEMSIYLARRFPAAAVFAVEPSPENLAVLRRNIAANPCPNLTVIPAAISDRSGHARISAGRGSENRIGNGVEVEALTLPALYARCRIERADLLKIDVEGHQEAFADDLARVAFGILAIELQPGSRVPAALWGGPIEHFGDYVFDASSRSVSALS